MMKKIALIGFLLVSILDIIGIAFKIESLIFLFKPLILLSLLFLYSNSVVDRNKWYSTALVFSFFGDVFLIYSGDFTFKVGLISFLIAHILFISVVIKRIQKTSFLKALIAAIPFFIVLTGLIFLIKNALNELLVPVVIYGITISIFGMVSFLDYSTKKTKESLWMLFGAIVFMISDSILAINKFYESSLFFEIIVMVTYVSAQYLIYKSMVCEQVEEAELKSFAN